MSCLVRKFPRGCDNVIYILDKFACTYFHNEDYSRRVKPRSRVIYFVVAFVAIQFAKIDIVYFVGFICRVNACDFDPVTFPDHIFDTKFFFAYATLWH